MAWAELSKASLPFLLSFSLFGEGISACPVWLFGKLRGFEGFWCLLIRAERERERVRASCANCATCNDNLWGCLIVGWIGWDSFMVVATCNLASLYFGPWSFDFYK
jgi:hypothetical protein